MNLHNSMLATQLSEEPVNFPKQLQEESIFLFSATKVMIENNSMRTNARTAPNVANAFFAKNINEIKISKIGTIHDMSRVDRINMPN